MTMTVKDLIEALSSMPPDAQVILQKDGEGNGYSPLADANDNCVYTPDTTWSGEIFDCSWSPADACMDADEHAEMMAKPRCVVLAPTN
jgi:hypothetical protein